MEWRLDGEIDGDLAVEDNYHDGYGSASFSNNEPVMMEEGETDPVLPRFPSLFQPSSPVKWVAPPGGSAVINVEFKVSRGRVTFTDLDVQADDITLEMLRAISLGEMRAAILDQLQEQFPIRRFEEELTSAPTELRKHWPRGEKLPQLLQAVAKVYNHALARENPPTMSVANEFDVSRATASRMIAKAREDGIKLEKPAPYPGKRKKVTGNGKNKTQSRTPREDHNQEG